MYPHMTARGRHPFYVLGKGVFYKVADLVALGGFNPWLTIEDPEVGMRLWVNGRTLGVSDVPLIEEVPRTFRGGVTQRKRWVAGFFQSLHVPLSLMGMSFTQRMKARLNLVPCLSLAVNALGLPLAIWMILASTIGRERLDLPLMVLSVVNLAAAIAVLTRVFVAAWARSALVLTKTTDRLAFMARVNPVFLLGYWLFWLIPLTIGIAMFVSDRGLVWQRTQKLDANHDLIRSAEPAEQAVPSPNGTHVLATSSAGPTRAGAETR
jgi:cellulose synthase/poly-beta-1,6-N-acetylglucosamine synthase-like glycosyltransferase